VLRVDVTSVLWKLARLSFSDMQCGMSYHQGCKFFAAKKFKNSPISRVKKGRICGEFVASCVS